MEGKFDIEDTGNVGSVQTPGHVLVTQGSLAWMKERRKGIGASEAAAVLGVAGYGRKTRREVYFDKISTEPPTMEAPSEAAIWGTGLEDFVAKRYREQRREQFNEDVLVLRDNKIRYLVERPYIRASLDRIINGDKRAKNVPLEIKTTSGFASRMWEESETILRPVYLQVQHQLLVTGWDYADVCVGILDKRATKVYPVEANKEIHSWMLEEYAAFWKYVEERELPPATTADEFKFEVPVPGSRIEADSGILQRCLRLSDVKSEIKTLEEEKEMLEEEVKTYTGENEVLTDNGAILATWKGNTVSRFDSKRFKQEEPDTYEKYTAQDFQRRFLLKV